MRSSGMRARAALVAAVSVMVVAVAQAGPLALPATESTFSTSKQTKFWPVYDAAGNLIRTDTWRAVRNTGNSNEHYLTSTSTGRLLDFGGTRLRFSDDEGVTWREVVAGRGSNFGNEGAVVVAPGGDVAGISWDPFSGDRIIAFRYSAATGLWEYMENVLRTPFFDRPWMAVVRGPVTLGPLTAPYAVLIKGGLNKDLLYYSLDGLVYVAAGHPGTEAALTQATPGWPQPAIDPELDWLQPHTASQTTTIGTGRALNRQTFLSAASCPWKILDETMEWSCSDATFTGRVQADSLGRMHEVFFTGSGSGFTYRLHPVGGSGPSDSDVDLPPGYRAETWDFKVHGALGIGAVAVHAHHNGSNTDRDFLYKFSVAQQPVLDEVHYVGNGDHNFGSSITSSGARFDFASVAILPSGHVALTFGDSSYQSVGLAIQR